MVKWILRVIILIGLLIALFLFASYFVPSLVPIVLPTKIKYALVFISALMLIAGGLLKDKLDN